MPPDSVLPTPATPVRGAKGPYRHAAFGIAWHADLPLAQFDEADGPHVDADRPVVTVRQRTNSADRGEGAVFDDGLRFAWRDEAVFDLHHGTRVEYRPGADWTGTMPAAFYSTVAALTLAWRGALPLHASAVEIGGKAVLIAGMAAAGKSTLTAELLLTGGRLIGDDLSVLSDTPPDAPFAVTRGRPTIRLHPDTAQRLPATACAPVPGDDRGKWLVRPLARATLDAVPLAGVIMLGASDGRLPGPAAAQLLGETLFRPRWLRRLPAHPARLRMVLALAGRVPVHGLVLDRSIHKDRATVAKARRAIDALVRG